MVSYQEFKDRVLAESGMSEAEFEASIKTLEKEVAVSQLREIRKQAGMTQVQVAKKLGVTAIRISQIETGDLEKVNVSTLRNYLNQLGAELSLVAKVAGREFHLPLSDK
jgi:DNA-binding XRE family transcriptional regulator